MTRTKPYNDYGTWIRERLHHPVQKLPIDAGLTCPNRDGTISTGGCTYCDNSSFAPPYCDPTAGISEQIARGKAFFVRKGKSPAGYLAYFQSYTGTYGDPCHIISLYEQALAVAGIEGLVIGTRPDCLHPDIVAYLAERSKHTYVCVEIGIESANDATLRDINRGHDYAASKRAIEVLHQEGIITGAHVILGLPGEDEDEILSQTRTISALPLDILKIHQLQVIRGTRLASEYSNIYLDKSPEEYISLLARYISRLRHDIVLERFFTTSPLGRVMTPRWGIKPNILTKKLCEYMHEHSLWQGKYYKDPT